MDLGVRVHQTKAAVESNTAPRQGQTEKRVGKARSLVPLRIVIARVGEGE